METNLLQKLLEVVNLDYLITLMILAYMIKRYFKAFVDKIIKKDVPMVYVVMTIAVIVAVPFAIWMDVSIYKLIVTYAVATSFHELIFGWIEKLFR